MIDASLVLDIRLWTLACPQIAVKAWGKTTRGSEERRLRGWLAWGADRYAIGGSR
jgi:hypothetical protein